ncbi:MAG: hypothetical protein ACTSPY_07400 [Candidatus Helarchaeota archaeon]
MYNNDRINGFIIFASLLIIFSIFLPWVKYMDISNNYYISLNALNLLFGTFGMSNITWSNWIDTYGLNIYHIPMILPIISGIIGLVLGFLRFFEKYNFIKEDKHSEILFWSSTISFGSIIYIIITSYASSNYLWSFNIIIYVEGTGVLLNFLGTSILLICGLLLKKYEH